MHKSMDFSVEQHSETASRASQLTVLPAAADGIHSLLIDRLELCTQLLDQSENLVGY